MTELLSFSWSLLSRFDTAIFEMPQSLPISSMVSS